MLCYRRIHPWCASSPYDEAQPIVCRFCASSPGGLTHFQAHNVQMRQRFVISGCATDPAPVDSVPLVDRMVCVQAHRSSQTAPLIVPDIHRVLEGTGMLECPDHKLDHGVPDPKCDYCKRALGPLYRHSALRESREIPILTFDFSGPHPGAAPLYSASSQAIIGHCLVPAGGATDLGDGRRKSR